MQRQKRRLGKRMEKYKVVGMKKGNSAVAALLSPLAFFHICGLVANGKHFCHSGDRGMYRNKRWKDNVKGMKGEMKKEVGMRLSNE